MDVLVPTAGRPGGLAVTLTGLLGQRLPLRVVVADQTAGAPSYAAPEVSAVLRVLAHQGHRVECHHRPVRRGIAEQRAFLLSRASAAHALFLDDDVALAPWALGVMEEALTTLGCGFVGMATQGLSYAADRRPHEQVAFQAWSGPVRPERVRKGTPAWERWRLHNAANVTHLQERHSPAPGNWVAYKVAWIPGCVLFSTEALRASGGFDFWTRLPPAQRGEDVVAQLRVMERYGGAGLLPSGAYHLELPTSLPHRDADAYTEVLERDDRLERAAPRSA